MSQLMEDRRLMTDEHETYKARESEKYELLEQRLRKTQELLRDTTKDFLQVSHKIVYLVAARANILY